MFVFNKRGIALVIVLTVVLLVSSLAVVVLGFLLSYAQLTEHNMSRAKAYYAALAGMNLAMDKIRTNTTDWVPSSGSVTRTLCASGCNVTDSDMPYNVTIVIWGPTTSIDEVGRKIEITTVY